MTPEQKNLVQSTWKPVKEISDTAADLFYNRLFELDPELRPMFKGDMKEQGRKLMAMIEAAVNGLDNLGELTPAVEGLGRRHVTYNVKDEHYETVGAALIWTLEKGLGEAFTEDVKQAWVVVYTTLADLMKGAAAEGTAAEGVA